MALLVLCGAACGGPTQTRVALANTSHPPRPPSGPAPRLVSDPENQEQEYGWLGLPAVASDGSEIVTADRLRAGGAISLDLIVESIDRQDRPVKSLEVVPADEKIAPGKLDEANRWLADEHRARDLTPMPAATVTPNHEGNDATAWSATYGGVTLQIDLGAKLTVTGGGKTLVERAAHEFEAPVQHLDGGDCHNPLSLEDAWIDPARRIALIRVEYHGNDHCIEPDPSLHVVSW
jgi:hypothetical protein